jgi:hypothetical protein
MRRSKKDLFDHLIGTYEQRGWNGQAEGLAVLKLMTMTGIVLICHFQDHST